MQRGRAAVGLAGLAESSLYALAVSIERIGQQLRASRTDPRRR
jgi:hypothetical protein